MNACLRQKTHYRCPEGSKRVPDGLRNAHGHCGCSYSLSERQKKSLKATTPRRAAKPRFADSHTKDAGRGILVDQTVGIIPARKRITYVRLPSQPLLRFQAF
jgi:hypothetical protein